MATKTRSTKSPAARSTPTKVLRPTHLEPLSLVDVELRPGFIDVHDDEPSVPATLRTFERFRGDLVSIVSIIGLLTLSESSP